MNKTKTFKDFLPETYMENSDHPIDEGLFQKGATLAYAKKVKTHGDRANAHLRRAIDKSESESEIELARAMMDIREMLGALTAVVVSGVVLKKG